MGPSWEAVSWGGNALLIQHTLPHGGPFHIPIGTGSPQPALTDIHHEQKAREAPNSVRRAPPRGRHPKGCRALTLREMSRFQQCFVLKETSLKYMKKRGGKRLFVTSLHVKEAAFKLHYNFSPL